MLWKYLSCILRIVFSSSLPQFFAVVRSDFNSIFHVMQSEELHLYFYYWFHFSFIWLWFWESWIRLQMLKEHGTAIKTMQRINAVLMHNNCLLLLLFIIASLLFLCADFFSFFLSSVIVSQIMNFMKYRNVIWKINW